MVTHKVHLKTRSPLGQRDSAPHVIQLPEVKSLSLSDFPFGGPVGWAGAFDRDPEPSPNISASVSESESKSSCAFFLDGGGCCFLAG